MTSPARVRFLAYQAFYRLPARWRRRLVRLGTTKYTVGAVVLVRAADAGDPGALLLLRQPPSRGWSLPGGLLGRREHPAAGAARELAEETGIRLSPDQVRAAVPNAILHSHGRWVDLVFEATVPKDVPLAVDGAEVYEAAWHPLDALPPLSRPTAKLLGYYDIGPLAGQGRALDD